MTQKYKIMMKLIKQLKYIIIPTIFLIFIIYLIANRLLIREDRTLPYEFNRIYFMLFLLFLCFIIILLLIIFFNKKFVNNSESLTKILKGINEQLNVVVIFVSNKIMHQKFPDIYQYLQNKTNFLFIIYLISSCLIRFILLLMFFIDVVYLNKISYFYKILPLLLVPLSFRLFYYFFKRFLEIPYEILGPKIQTVFQAGVIDIKDYANKAAIHRLKSPQKFFDGYILLDPDYFFERKIQTGKNIDAQKTMDKFDNTMNELIEQQMVLSNFELKKALIEPFFTLIIRICYFLLWSYVLYLNDPVLFFEIINFIANIHEKIKNPFSNP